MILEDGPLFIADTHVHPDPTPEQIAETAIGAARHVRRFGLTPKIALCTQSQFGNIDTPSPVKMRDALEILDAREPDFAYEGEMNIDAALDADARPPLPGLALWRGRRTSWSSPRPMPPRACATSSRSRPAGWRSGRS
jgi:malate dehydrogenase (oxaloacetate-decarboxylating)(NADP+)